MLEKIKLDSFHVPILSELDKIRKNIQFMEEIANQCGTLSNSLSKSQKQQYLQKNDNLKNEIRDKIKLMGSNLDQITSVIDHKINLIIREINKMQKNKGNAALSQSKRNLVKTKLQQEYQYKIMQLEERIFELQKRQNQNVKQLSHLKSTNSKLRQEFSNLSFDSNQRIKELSQKLHNNTSPALGIKRQISAKNPETSFLGSDENDLSFKQKRVNNNFIKIKANLSDPYSKQPEVENYKSNTKNILDSLSSESSQYDANGLGFQHSGFEQSSGNLKFGCFPGKQISQKTKTGSSIENKNINNEERNDKNRRFEFLLSNLREAKSSQIEQVSCRQSQGMESYRKIDNFFNDNEVKRFQI